MTTKPRDDHPKSEERDRFRWWPYPVCAAIAATLVFCAARSTLIDDAYIALDYVRDVAFHWHWGLVPQLTANTATSALEILVTAAFTVLTRDPVVALGIVYVLCALAVEFGLRRAAAAVGLPRWTGLLAVGLITIDPLLISAIGLEVCLDAAVIALLVAAAVRERPVWFGVLAGLAVLTRPDLVIVVLVVFVLRRGWWRRWWVSLLAALVVALPWYFWSWRVLGSAVPATLFIKIGQGSWGSNDFGNGPAMYFAVFPTATVLSFLPAALGLLAALGWLIVRLRRAGPRVLALGRLIALPVAGGLHYLAYTALHVAPYHWYYGPSIVCGSFFLAAATGAVAPRRGVHGPALTGGIAVLASAGALLTVSAVTYAEGLGSPYPPIFTNWAQPAQYQAIGPQLHQLVGDQPVRSPGEIGALAYYCDCEVVDEFSDPGYVPRVLATVHGGGLKHTLLDWDTAFLNRSQPVVVPRYLLTFSRTRPTTAIRSWPVDSDWIGANYLVLQRNPAADQ